MKKQVTKEYFRRVRKIMKSRLYGYNKIRAINTYATPVIRYSGAIIKWNTTDIQQIDGRTRKMMTIHRALHPKADVDRLYLPKEDGRLRLD